MQIDTPNGASLPWQAVLAIGNVAVAALACGRAYYEWIVARKKAQHAPGPPRSKLKRSDSLLLVLLAILLALSGVTAAFLWRADREREIDEMLLRAQRTAVVSADLELAAHQYEDVLRVSPAEERALVGACYCYSQLKSLVDAIPYAVHLRALHPGDPSYDWNLASLYVDSKQPREAIKVIESNPRITNRRYRLGYAYLEAFRLSGATEKTGDFSRAVDNYVAVEQGNIQWFAWSRYNLACAYSLRSARLKNAADATDAAEMLRRSEDSFKACIVEANKVGAELRDSIIARTRTEDDLVGLRQSWQNASLDEWLLTNHL